MINTVYKGKFLSFMRYETFVDVPAEESKKTWEFVQRNEDLGVVMVVPVTRENEIVLIEQERHPIGTRCIELPAGLIDPQDPSRRHAAMRELEEETGYNQHSIHEWKQIAECASSPGMSAETFHLFLAKNVQKVSKGGGIDDEDITVLKYPIDSALEAVQARILASNGTLLVHSAVLAGIFLARS